MQYILMADVVGSSKLDGNNVISSLKDIVSTVNLKYKAEILSPLTITLGDEFQSIISNFQMGVEMIFSMDEYILNNGVDFDLRYVINKGKVDTPINPQVAHEMYGKGLTDARSLLELVKREKTKVLIANNGKQASLINSALILYQYFFNQWRPKDRKLAGSFLAGKDYKQLAIEFKRDPSSIWRKKRSMAVDEFLECRNLIRSLIAKYDTKNSFYIID